MSEIEWTGLTWNPVTGCTPVSAGCDHCYARRMAKRLQKMQPVAYANGFKVTCHPKRLNIPLRWWKPRMVFVCSMGDLFHADVPFDFIDKVFAVMALCPQHTFQLLTKRPERMLEYQLTRAAMDDSGRVDRSPQWYHVITAWIDEGETGRLGTRWGECHDVAAALCMQRPLPNVWAGTSIENQETADERIPHLLNCPAAVRFLSIEPMLGPVDLFQWMVTVWQSGQGTDRTYRMPGIEWVIVCGESGPGARPMDPAWVRSIRDQCRAAGVLFFMKQMGSHWARKNGLRGKGNNMADWPAKLRIREMPETAKRKD